MVREKKQPLTFLNLAPLSNRIETGQGWHTRPWKRGEKEKYLKAINPNYIPPKEVEDEQQQQE